MASGSIASDLARRILAVLPGKTILVVGDVILDEYVSGDVKRISPEAPVPIVEFRARVHVAGGAANVAANIAALGCHPGLAGIIGADGDGEHLCAALEKAGVKSDGLLHDTQRPTTVKLRILAQNQQIVRLDREVHTPIMVAQENALLDWLTKNLTRADACILSDYGKGLVTARLARQIIATCKAAGVPILIDPKSLECHLCQGAALVKPNRHEAERLANCAINDEAGFLDAGRHLASLLPGTGVLITRGALGMSLFRHGVDPFHVSTAARKVYDVTGAGDTVISMLSMALAAGATPEDAVWFASQGAAVVVEKLGTATLTAAELLARCEDKPFESQDAKTTDFADTTRIE